MTFVIISQSVIVTLFITVNAHDPGLEKVCIYGERTNNILLLSSNTLLLKWSSVCCMCLILHLFIKHNCDRFKFLFHHK